LHGLTGSQNLCLAGGVALNCVGNGRILRESPFKRLWVQPASGDAGGALGAALFVWYQLLENVRRPQVPDGQCASLLGPSCKAGDTEAMLRAKGAVYRHFPGGAGLCEEAARLIAGGSVVGWVQGRMEFGPRALGARSILGDARNATMQEAMNLKIKFRESFRPFAPIVLRERASEYFELGADAESPYMLIVAPVRADKLRIPSATEKGLGRINAVRSVIPAVTHVDNTARIQTVDRQRNPRLCELLEAFDRLTGCPVMINTSFNIRGEPIVCTAADAFRCFMATNIDVLIVDDFLLLKDQQRGERPSLQAYLAKYGND
jgi:carbamoyltransferase